MGSTSSTAGFLRLFLERGRQLRLEFFEVRLVHAERLERVVAVLAPLAAGDAHGMRGVDAIGRARARSAARPMPGSPRLAERREIVVPQHRLADGVREQPPPREAITHVARGSIGVTPARDTPYHVALQRARGARGFFFMKRPIRILLVEDSKDDADLLLWEMRSGGFEPVCRRVETLAEMTVALEEEPWDVIVSDYTMPQFSGLRALELVQKHRPDLPVIIVSGDIGEEIAVEAMRAGARDYVMKSALSRLVPAIERELRENVVRRAGRAAQRELQENEARLRGLVSNIPGMVFQLTRGGTSYVFPYVSEGSLALPRADPAPAAGRAEALLRHALRRQPPDPRAGPRTLGRDDGRSELGRPHPRHRQPHRQVAVPAALRRASSRATACSGRAS